MGGLLNGRVDGSMGGLVGRLCRYVHPCLNIYFFTIYTFNTHF